MSIELVDKIDQAQKSNRRYKKVGGLNDLFLHDEEASVTSHTTSGDEYVGLELETIVQKRDKKRVALTIVLVLILSIFIGVVIGYHRTNSTSAANSSSHPHSSGTGSTSQRNPDDESPTSGEQDNDDSDDNIDIGSHGQSMINVTWHTAAPLPKFSICKPSIHYKHSSNSIHHMADVVIVPEDKDLDDPWNYTFSSMDIDEHASIIAVGLNDFSGYTDWAVGLVRVFAFSCHTKTFQQLGQDLIGTMDGEMFGSKVASSKDGMVMAVSATQSDIDNQNGFVQVYFFDSDNNKWALLGQRIGNLDDLLACFNMGSAIDLSDNGQTLAIAGAVDDSTFVTRVFFYDTTTKQWMPRGHSISTTIPQSDYDFSFEVSLSEAGDELAFVDPTMGLVKYHFVFESDKWVKGEDARKPVFENSDSVSYWIEGVDFDKSGDIVAVEAFQYDTSGMNEVQIVKVVDFSNNTFTEVYNKTIPGNDLSISSAVSSDGSVVALIASRYDSDDQVFYELDVYGTMMIASKKHDGVWKLLRQGNSTNGIGVPGGEVALSADGSIAAVGTDSKIALYTMSFDVNVTKPTTSDGDQTPAADVTIDDSAHGSTNRTVSNGTFFKICAPFPSASAAHVGDIDSLPKQEDEHSLEIALSGNGSLVAVGIDSWANESRGMVRVFAWDCDHGKYTQWGQDLYGTNTFDAFGQSVDLSSDGKILVVGASQPPPGRTGYVDIYTFGTDGLWDLQKRFDEVHPGVEDIGRKVSISSDGSTVAIHGNFEGGDYGLTSFIRVIEKLNGKWVNKGDDLIGTIEYDDFGNTVLFSFAADGSTLGVTGSYNSFMAKMYSYDKKKSNWTETIIPPIKPVGKHDIAFDTLCEEYFDGSDISLSDDGRSVAIAGTLWSTDSALVRLLTVDSLGNWSLSRDPIAYDGAYTAASIDISGDAQMVAVGINVQGNDKPEQGAMFVSIADSSNNGWKALGQVEGRNKRDLLGSRVSVSADGRLAAASSNKGYISFFKVNQTLSK